HRRPAPVPDRQPSLRLLARTPGARPGAGSTRSAPGAFLSAGPGMGLPPLRRHRLPAQLRRLPRLRGGAHSRAGVHAQPQPAPLPGAQCRDQRAGGTGATQRGELRPVPALPARAPPRRGMDDHGTAEFDQFLVGAWSDTRFLELRDAPEPGSQLPGKLLAVAVTDRVSAGLSAVYT